MKRNFSRMVVPISCERPSRSDAGSDSNTMTRIKSGNKQRDDRQRRKTIPAIQAARRASPAAERQAHDQCAQERNEQAARDIEECAEHDHGHHDGRGLRHRAPELRGVRQRIGVAHAGRGVAHRPIPASPFRLDVQSAAPSGTRPTGRSTISRRWFPIWDEVLTKPPRDARFLFPNGTQIPAPALQSLSATKCKQGSRHVNQCLSLQRRCGLVRSRSRVASHAQAQGWSELTSCVGGRGMGNCVTNFRDYHARPACAPRART